MRATLPRAMSRAISLLIGAVAFNAGHLVALAAPATNDSASAASCGMGRLSECGVETTYSTRWTLLLSLDDISQSGGYSFGKRAPDEMISSKTLYRDPPT